MAAERGLKVLVEGFVRNASHCTCAGDWVANAEMAIKSGSKNKERRAKGILRFLGSTASWPDYRLHHGIRLMKLLTMGNFDN